jgi:hypothetical protein
MRLGLEWFTWVQTCNDVRLVVVMLVPQADDVAALLRTVEEWGRHQRLDAIPFALDGRRYVLEGRNRPAASVAA